MGLGEITSQFSRKNRHIFRANPPESRAANHLWQSEQPAKKGRLTSKSTTAPVLYRNRCNQCHLFRIVSSLWIRLFFHFGREDFEPPFVPFHFLWIFQSRLEEEERGKPTKITKDKAAKNRKGGEELLVPFHLSVWCLALWTLRLHMVFWPPFNKFSKIEEKKVELRDTKDFGHNKENLVNQYHGREICVAPRGVL